MLSTKCGKMEHGPHPTQSDAGAGNHYKNSADSGAKRKICC